MKKLAFLLFAAIPALAQYNPPAVTATALYQYASAPSTCTVGQVYVLISTFVPYYCSAANTWTAFGGGGGGTPYPSGTGIPAVAGGTAWGTTYNASNLIPASYFYIASGTTALATSAITTGACQAVTAGSVNSTAATNAVTTNVLSWSPAVSLQGVTGYQVSTSGALSIDAYITSGYVNFNVCNWTTGSITPGALTLNWRVLP